MKLPHLILPLFFFLLFASPAAEAANALYQYCGTTGNYTTNSTYQSNLKTLFTDLIKSSTNSTTNFGFAKSSVGSIPNLILGLVLCRGDDNSSACSSCLNQATQDIQNLCPYNKEATIYYDHCLLRYSNQNFLSSTDNSDQIIMYNTQNVSVSFTLFENRVNYLMNSTANYAAFKDSKKFATSQMNSIDSFPVIMGLVQCTPDMSGTDCNSCLQNLIGAMPQYFSGNQEGRILGVRCNIRYGIYSFYSGAALLTVTAPAAPAPAPSLPPRVTNPPSEDKKKTSTDTNLTITVPLVLAFVVIAGLEFNSYPANNIPSGATLNITVNCSCGDSSVSDQYGLFETYPLHFGENASFVASTYNISAELAEEYNPGVNFSSVGAILYVPARDANGSYRALSSTSKWNLSGGAIAGTVIGAIAILLSIGLVSYCLVDKRGKTKKASLLPLMPGESPHHLEFSYEELSKATNDFSMANKIGQGGFGSVYYAVLRGEKAAIKKMETQASNLFLAELNVLTHVHHSNIVQLIGYCIEGVLFLVYEYIGNGDLSQHLRSGSWSPLSWANRVQIALDSARGLEYIHEHTVPVYIHRDIKSSNILIDEKGRAKVADFGLARLTKVGSKSFLTGPVGTIGYMSPEYGQYGRVSPKVDVYAFGIVLYELISAKGAIVTIEPSSDASSEANAKGLVGLFDDALMDEDPKERLQKLVDPRLGNDYPIESLMKMAQLAKACTQYKPHKRPGMRSVVVTLIAVADLMSS